MIYLSNVGLSIDFFALFFFICLIVCFVVVVVVFLFFFYLFCFNYVSVFFQEEHDVIFS